MSFYSFVFIWVPITFIWCNWSLKFDEEKTNVSRNSLKALKLLDIHRFVDGNCVILEITYSHSSTYKSIISLVQPIGPVQPESFPQFDLIFSEDHPYLVMIRQPGTFWAHLCLCTLGSYASLSVCLSVCLGLLRLHIAPLQRYMGYLCTRKAQYAPPRRNMHHGAQGRLYLYTTTH